MQRKAIRATVGGSDVDIPIHTFLPNQFVYFDGSGTGALTTAVAVTPVGTPVAGNVAEWFSATSIVDSGISLANVVTTTATPTAAQVAVFTGVGKAIAPATVTIVGGAVSNVTAIDGVNPLTWVVGPASAVDSNLASFNGTTGKVIKDSGILVTNIVTTASSPAANTVATFTGTGKAIQPVSVTIIGGAIANGTTLNGKNINNLVTGSAGAVSLNVAVYNGTSGFQIVDTGVPSGQLATSAAVGATNAVALYVGANRALVASTVIITGGDITGVTTINGTTVGDFVTGPASAVNNRVAAFNGTTGKIIKDGGILVTDVVLGPASSTNNRIAVFSGTTGKLIVDAAVIYTDIVIGPASAVSGDIVTFSGTTGKLIQDSGVTAANIVTTTATPTAGLVPVFTGVGKAVAPSAVTLTGGAFTGVTGIDGVDITSHVSRHTVGGADSMFALTWGTNKADTPAYVGSGTFYPRFIYTSIESAQTLNTSVTGVSVPVSIPRNGRYVCRFVFFVTSDGSAGTLTGYATWGAGVGLALFNIAPGIAGGVVTTSGSSTAMSIPSGKAAWIIYVDLTVYNAVAGGTIYVQFSWSSTPASLSDGGSTTVIEYSS